MSRFCTKVFIIFNSRTRLVLLRVERCDYVHRRRRWCRARKKPRRGTFQEQMKIHVQWHGYHLPSTKYHAHDKLPPNDQIHLHPGYSGEQLSTQWLALSNCRGVTVEVAEFGWKVNVSLINTVSLQKNIFSSLGDQILRCILKTKHLGNSPWPFWAMDRVFVNIDWEEQLCMFAIFPSTAEFCQAQNNEKMEEATPCRIGVISGLRTFKFTTYWCASVCVLQGQPHENCCCSTMVWSKKEANTFFLPYPSSSVVRCKSANKYSAEQWWFPSENLAGFKLFWNSMVSEEGTGSSTFWRSRWTYFAIVLQNKKWSGTS